MSIFEDLGIPADGPFLESVLRLGRTLGDHRDQMVVGRDSGPGNAILFNALSSGLSSVGCNVRDIGIAPAPTLAFACKGRSDGIMICPPDREGEVCMKLWNRDGTMFTGLQMAAVRASAHEMRLPRYGSVGTITEQSGALARHRSAILDILGGSDCPVVLDCSSNCASLIAPPLLTDMGCDLIAVNSQVSGSPVRKGIDEGSLRDLLDIVHRNTGEIGIAINGDGTRIAGTDEHARYLNGETILAIFVEYLAPRKVVVPVSASMMIDDIVQGDVIRVPAGDASLGEAVLRHGADLGGGSGGSFVFPELTCGPDGIYGAALLAKIAGEVRLNETVDSFPVYHMEHESVRYEGRRTEIGRRISEQLETMEYRRLIDTDGWRVEMDGGWYLIRFSGREEQTIRITAEARDEVYMISLMDIAKDVVRNALK